MWNEGKSQKRGWEDGKEALEGGGMQGGRVLCFRAVLPESSSPEGTNSRPSAAHRSLPPTQVHEVATQASLHQGLARPREGGIPPGPLKLTSFCRAPGPLERQEV